MRNIWLAWGARQGLALAALCVVRWRALRQGCGGRPATAAPRRPGAASSLPSGKASCPSGQPRCRRVMEFSGPLVAPQTAVVRAKAAGTLLTLAVAEGSRVQAGQVLGTHRPGRAVAAALAERNAMLESARAALAQAERTPCQQPAPGRPAVHLADRAGARRAPRWTTARAQVRAAQAQLDTVRVALRDAALRGADRRHRRQAPCRARREGRGRAARC